MVNLGTILIVLLSIAAFIDLVRHQVPNWLTGGGILVAIVWTLLDPANSVGLTSALTGTLAGLAFFYPVFLIGKVGAGDVKLLGMAGAFLGPATVFWGAMYSLIAGGVLAIAWMLMLKVAPLQVRRMVPNATSTVLFSTKSRGKTFSSNKNLAGDPRRLPYACAIAIGCSLAYLGY